MNTIFTIKKAKLEGRCLERQQLSAERADWSIGLATKTQAFRQLYNSIKTQVTALQ